MEFSWNPVLRRYLLRFSISMVLYVVVLIASLRLLRTQELQGPLLYLVAVAPALPILGVIWAMGAFVVELKDEYQRMRLVRAMMIATGLSLSIFTVVGFLQNSGAIQAEPLWAFPIWCACLGLAQVGGRILDR
ncbi:hypothetical protein [Caulobacter sp. NIBR2454]|uniref:hypothetical protein n=1 Tax=Caulobacter sp. NIBR2454 TaxID=3015996 RepID=UPI0022B726C3|nr:hypothetical protein [Caulobacter sp. NIBR2454]